jgi:hypothetical protein
MSVWCGVRRSGSRMWERLIQARARSEREGWDEKEGALQSADVCRVGPVAGVAMRLAGRFATTLARPPCRLPVSRPDELSAHCPPPAARPRLLNHGCNLAVAAAVAAAVLGWAGPAPSLVAGRWPLSLSPLPVQAAARQRASTLVLSLARFGRWRKRHQGQTALMRCRTLPLPANTQPRVTGG